MFAAFGAHSTVYIESAAGFGSGWGVAVHVGTATDNW